MKSTLHKLAAASIGLAIGLAMIAAAKILTPNDNP
jgi:hypothetical protein